MVFLCLGNPFCCSCTSKKNADATTLTRKRKMILTKCAACAAPLAHDHKARCIRCKTRHKGQHAMHEPAGGVRERC